MHVKQAAVFAVLGGLLIPGYASAQSDVSAAPSSSQDEAASASTEVPTVDASLETPAPSDSEPAAQKSRGSRVMEEIIVTAQKREENLQDVPISVAAFSGDKLEALGIDNAAQLPQITPGLQYDGIVGYNLVFIRGVGTEVFIPTAENSVATYVDGVYLPFSSGLAQDFGKLERIEVLKGPQGTLFGRNVTGGAISIITKKPEREYAGSFAVEGGNFNTRKFKTYLTGPIGDQVQIGLSAVVGASDPYYRRVSDSQIEDKPFPNEQSHGVQLKVNWDITDDLAVTVSGQSTREKGLSSSIFTSQDTKPAFRAIVPDYDEPYASDPDTPSYFRAQSDLIYTQFRWDSPSFFDLKLLGSYQDVTTGLYIDFEGSSAPIIGFNPKNQGGNFTTAELQFTSNDNSWRSDQFKWVAGYYFYNSSDVGFRSLGVDVLGSVTDPIFGQLLTDLNSLYKSSGLGDILPLVTGVPPGVSVELSGLIASRSHAVYGQGTYNFTDELGLTLGARFQREERDLTQSTIGLELADQTASPPIIDFQPQTQKASDVSPKVTLDYRLFDDSLVYVSWQQGFKSGTFNSVNITKPPTSVKPEKISAYEAGVKGTLLDGSLQFASAAFLYDIKDLQQLIVSLQSSGAISIENAAEAEIKGVDLETTWQPAPDSLPGLVLTGSGVLLRGEFPAYPNASGFDEITGLFRSGGLDYSGNTTTRTPKYTYNVGVSYRFELTDSSLETSVNYYRNAGYFFDAHNLLKQDPYFLLNVQASYQYEPWNLRLSLFGKNLTEEVYFLNKFETDFNTAATYAQPRSYGARIEIQF